MRPKFPNIRLVSGVPNLWPTWGPALTPLNFLFWFLWGIEYFLSYCRIFSGSSQHFLIRLRLLHKALPKRVLVYVESAFYTSSPKTNILKFYVTNRKQYIQVLIKRSTINGANFSFAHACHLPYLHHIWNECRAFTIHIFSKNLFLKRFLSGGRESK